MNSKFWWGENERQCLNKTRCFIKRTWPSLRSKNRGCHGYAGWWFQRRFRPPNQSATFILHLLNLSLDNLTALF